jgi:hypothetical protein
MPALALFAYVFLNSSISSLPINRYQKQGLEKLDASGASASSSPENAEILEKVEKVIATLEGGGEEGGEEEE